MRCTCLSVIAAVLAAVFSGCSSDGISATASYNPDYGPFDQNGNYVEAWADKPAKKHWWSRQSSPEPVDATPPRVRERPPLVASVSRPSAPPRVNTSPVAQPRLVRPTTRPVSLPRSAPTPPPVAYTPTPPPVVSTPAPRPKPVSQPKPKPKPKPAPKPVVRHTVKKGDTLYGLSRRYGVSVSAIQSANGISGTTIRLGQSIKIPK